MGMLNTWNNDLLTGFRQSAGHLLFSSSNDSDSQMTSQAYLRHPTMKKKSGLKILLRLRSKHSKAKNIGKPKTMIEGLNNKHENKGAFLMRRA